jgi:hypothetical protein
MATVERGRWERHAALTGVVAVVLWVIGALISESGASRPDEETPENLLTWFEDEKNTILAGELLFVFGALFFIWFLGSLRATLFRAEGGVGRVTSIAYGAGMLAALALILQAAALIQPSFVDEGVLSADGAQSLSLISDALFGVVELTLVPMFVAAGLVVLRTGVLPVWLGWASLLIAVVLLIIPIGWIGVIFLFPLWVLVTSVLLWLREKDEAPAALTSV